MAVSTRFDNLDEETLERIVTEKDSANTHQVIKTAVNVMKDYLSEKSLGTIDDMNSGTSEYVDGILRKFYAELKKVDGSRYTKKSMITIRYGLQRHFLKKRDEDIINSDQYKKANEMFKSVLVKLKKAGFAETKHKNPIDPKDMEKLYNSDVFSTDTPESLPIIEYLYYFCNRGRENLRNVQKNDFQIRVDAEGRRYVTVSSRQTKNHRGDDLRDKDKEGRMYDQPGNPNCPVTTFEKYFNKLHPGNANFWQRPKKVFSKEMGVWYDNSPVGKNTLNNFMAELSRDAGLSAKYTNHCIRATCITKLDHQGIEARHIMSISGHKSENSIRSYSERLSENKKRQISDILSESILSIPMKSSRVGNMTCASNILQIDSGTSVSSNSSTTCSTSTLQLPDFFDDEFDNIMADITAFELKNVTNTDNISVNKTPASTSELQLPNEFHFQNCTVNINFNK